MSSSSFFNEEGGRISKVLHCLVFFTKKKREKRKEASLLWEGSLEEVD